MTLVVIDPGHGGSTRCGLSSPYGVRGPRGTREKDFTLALARRLGERLAPDVRVHLTRDRDENRSLSERAQAARQLGARAFLSLHANGGPAGSRGCETWIHPDASPGAHALAQRVVRALAPVSGAGGRVMSGELSVLDPRHLGSAIDACLVEVDYLTDGAVESRLGEEDTLEAIAQALAGAVLAHLGGERVVLRGQRGPRWGAGSYWPTKYPVIGLDVSHYQGKIDWNQLHGWRNPDGNQMRFGLIKASEGAADDRFDRNWALACGSQRHETEAVLARVVRSLADAGTTVSKDDVRDDLALVSSDGSYPYIDGGMGAISEAAAHVLTHAQRQHGGFTDLIATMVARHGGVDALGDELVKALETGTSIEAKILKEITDAAVAAAAAGERAKLRSRYDKLLKKFRDPDITYYFSPATTDAGLVRGAYHFFHPRRSGTTQAQLLMDAIDAAGGLRDEDLPPIVDFETDDGMTSKTSVADALEECLVELERLSGRVPFIYTSPGLWDGFIARADDGRFARYPLWVARYDRGDKDPTSLDPARPHSHHVGFANVWEDPPSLPAYRADWAFWQIRIVPSGEVDGVAATLDCNVFSGDLDALQALTNRPATATGSAVAFAERDLRRVAGRFGAGSHERYPRAATPRRGGR